MRLGRKPEQYPVRLLRCQQYSPVSRLTTCSYAASSPAVLRRRHCRTPLPASVTSGPPVNVQSSSPSLPPLGSSGLVSVSLSVFLPHVKPIRSLTVHVCDRSCHRWLDRYERRFLPMDRLGPIHLVRPSLSRSRAVLKHVPDEEGDRLQGPRSPGPGVYLASRDVPAVDLELEGSRCIHVCCPLALLC